jgi:ubiquitin-conjugating enzyme E2 Z
MMQNQKKSGKICRHVQANSRQEELRKRQLTVISVPVLLVNLCSRCPLFPVTVTMTHNTVTERYQKRILNDIRELYSDPAEGIFVVPDDDKITILHALIVGPKDTPYESGFFYFVITFPEKYPLVPPKVKLMTTGNGSVRFNPNLYACGKVCLSIIGTWQGPGWTSVMTTKSVLISIQSLMNEKPFFNEPGFEKQESKYGSESKKYNDRILYEKLRVAVIDMADKSLSDSFNMPQVLRELVLKMFCERFESYQKMISDNMSLNGSTIKDRFSMGARPGAAASFDYKTLEKRLAEVRSKINLEENMAEQLYESLRTAHRKVKEGDESDGRGLLCSPNELFAPDDDPIDLDEDSSSLEAVDIADDDDDDDDVQILEPDAPAASCAPSKK